MKRQLTPPAVYTVLMKRQLTPPAVYTFFVKRQLTPPAVCSGTLFLKRQSQSLTPPLAAVYAFFVESAARTLEGRKSSGGMLTTNTCRDVVARSALTCGVVPTK